jgi:hypothetical protein
MTHRNMPTIRLNCRINRLDLASAIYAGLNRNCRRSNFQISMRLFTTFSISVDISFPRAIIGS